MIHARNFSIIAHINHGKSTLADRFIEICNGKNKIDKHQILDSMDLEREKGITIKSQCVTLNYTFKNCHFKLNLIDTPGHTDFSYEVSRALSACEGAILLIDASQGIEAQTMATYNKACEQNLHIIPVINKIDLLQANVNKTLKELESLTKLKYKNTLTISSKTGYGISTLLETIIKKIPHPTGNPLSSLQGLIIDSWYNDYLGIIALVRIKNGTLNKNDKIIVMSTQKTYKIQSMGIFTPNKIYTNILNTGDIGFIVMGCKNINTVPIGDTITSVKNASIKPLEGFKKIKPQIFTGIFPNKTKNFNNLKTALAKLALNDSSLEYKEEKSDTFGFGFRCGFLGMLHMEIIRERLKREYNLQIITAPPTIICKIILQNGKTHYINNASEIDKFKNIKYILEPIAKVNILTPKQFLGPIIQICIKNRGTQKNIIYIDNQISLTYDIPMIEIIFNFFDKLKTATKGYASLDYSFYKYEKSDLTKLDIIINKKKIDTMEFILHKNNALTQGIKIIDKLKCIIPKHMFDITIQASIKNKIIAKNVIKALRKNVTAKCYGGDITRKKKLLKKQTLGKKHMKQIGKVTIPQQAFLAILNTSITT